MPDPADTTLRAAVNRAADAQRRVIEAARQAAAESRPATEAVPPAPSVPPRKG